VRLSLPPNGIDGNEYAPIVAIACPAALTQGATLATCSFGGSGNSAAGTTGVAPPTYADYMAFANAGGLLTGVSPTNPLPAQLYGTLPAFASTPTVNLGTLNGAATATGVAAVVTALGTPFQAGGSIGNTAFGISGTLPAFASTPAFTISGTPTVITKPQTGTPSTPGCTVGTASAQCLAAGTATNSLFLQNTAASATIACSETATAALNSSTSFTLQPGQSMLFGANTGGVPTAALVCIASAASTPLYVRYN
jgi:hypothetical protein